MRDFVGVFEDFDGWIAKGEGGDVFIRIWSVIVSEKIKIGLFF